MSLEQVGWYVAKTGKPRDTIMTAIAKARLVAAYNPQGDSLYETVDALPAIYSLGKTVEMENARIENLLADTRLKALKEQETLGQLAPITALEWALSTVCSQISAILETIPAKLKRRLPQLTSADVDIVRKEIAKARNAAANIRIDLDKPETPPPVIASP